MSEESKASEGIRVIAFTEEEAAADALETLEKAKKDKSHSDFWDAAVIRKDERGRYYYHETRDRSTPKGAGIGASDWWFDWHSWWSGRHCGWCWVRSQSGGVCC